MDVTTLIGFIAGTIVFITSLSYTSAGFSISTLMAFYNGPSIAITFGGAIVATIINYPLKQLINVFRIVKKGFTEPGIDPTKVIPQIVDLTTIYRKEGPKALEEASKKIEDDFLRRAVQLVLGGRDQNFIQTMLETELSFLAGRHKIGQEIIITFATFCPAFGMIGTIIGLIQMLQNLEDAATIAQGMAVALLTTFYGAMASYFVLLPIAGKLKRRTDDEILIKEVIIRGVLLLYSGAPPTMVEENLKAYLPAKMIQQIQEQKEKKEKKVDKKEAGKNVPGGQKPPQAGARPVPPAGPPK